MWDMYLKVCDYPLCVEDTLESVCRCLSHVTNMYALCNMGCACSVAAIMYSQLLRACVAKCGVVLALNVSTWEILRYQLCMCLFVCECLWYGFGSD